MKLLIYLAVVPWLVAADMCPDLSTCPEGKICCAKSSEKYECCERGEDQKGLFSGTLSKAVDSTVSRKETYLDVCAFCSGTCCYGGCCEHKGARCCADKRNCCPRGYNCCDGSYILNRITCCPTGSICASTPGYCHAGAGSLIPAMSGMGALIFLLVFRGTYFL